MRKLLIAASCVVVASALSASAAWYGSDTHPLWLRRQKITIDSNKVNGSGTLTNFPVLITHTNIKNSLWASAQADGADILFTTGDGTNKLSHEFEGYDPATSQLWAWVRVPELSGSADTVLYMYYSYSAAADQQDASNVWINGYAAVWHLSETNPAGTIYNSTTNACNGSTMIGGAVGDIPISDCDTTNNWSGTDMSTNSDAYEGSACVRDTIAATVAGNVYTMRYQFASATDLGDRRLTYTIKSDTSYNNALFGDCWLNIYDDTGRYRQLDVDYCGCIGWGTSWKRELDRWGIHTGGTTPLGAPDSSAIDRIEWTFEAADVGSFWIQIDNLSVNGRQEADATGKIAGACPFDGYHDYIQTTSDSSMDMPLNNFTVVAWINHHADYSEHVVINRYDPGWRTGVSESGRLQSFTVGSISGYVPQSWGRIPLSQMERGIMQRGCLTERQRTRLPILTA